MSLLTYFMQWTPWSIHISATRTHHLAKTALFLKDNPFIQYARWNGVTIHFHYTEPHQIPCVICIAIPGLLAACCHLCVSIAVRSPSHCSAIAFPSRKNLL